MLMLLKILLFLGTAVWFTLCQNCIFIHILVLLLIQTENIFGKFYVQS